MFTRNDKIYSINIFHSTMSNVVEFDFFRNLAWRFLRNTGELFLKKLGIF